MSEPGMSLLSAVRVLVSGTARVEVQKQSEKSRQESDEVRPFILSANLAYRGSRHPSDALHSW